MATARALLARSLPPLVYAAVTLAIAAPLLSEGWLFHLDHAMGPGSADYYRRFLADNSDPIQNKGGFALLLSGLGLLMPLAWAQKLLLFLPFFLAGLGVHRLAERLTLGLGVAPALVGGLLYALSPFAYVRGLVGQMGVLWAYALAPWFLLAWFRYAEGGERRHLAAPVLLLSATALFQAHGAALLLGLAALHLVVLLATRQERARRVVARGAWFTLAVALVNAAWILPVLLAPETTLTAIGAEDRAAFATTDAGLPSVGLAALTLEGFWRAGYDTYYSARPLLLAVPLAALLLTVRGALPLRADPRRVTLVTAAAGGFLLAVGTASSITAPLFTLAWDHVPGFKGFRDAHKLLALVALAYGALAPAGLQAVVDALRRLPAPRAVGQGTTVALLAVALLAPVAAAEPLLAGYSGQVAPTAYPEGWAAAEEATRACDGNLLVAPWHLYLDLAWLPNREKRATNPAKLYFTCPAFTPDNLEIAGVDTQSPDPASRYLGHWLAQAGLAEGNPGGIRHLGNLLAPLNVQYVLVLKEADWRGLDSALRGQADLEPVLENGAVVLYENRAPRGATLPAHAAPPIRDSDDLVTLAAQEPLAGALFGASNATAAAEHVVHAPRPGIPVSAWRLDGEPPISFQLGFAPVFTRPVAGEARPEATLALAVTAWALSALSLAALLTVSAAAWARARRRAWVVSP